MIEQKQPLKVFNENNEKDVWGCSVYKIILKLSKNLQELTKLAGSTFQY